ncbi:CXXC-type zinc finger protein 1 [Thelohanellus kitauei]|uniref:CXXC-type zinc finger protein 1 n=1 Tax=Thelohanellus kitauei TaxID=669202 RepID=A0A0C2NDW8_THEKT|nr:CXXC-type zinc finger protein 1 [Thelohanellus kitauei]
MQTQEDENQTSKRDVEASLEANIMTEDMDETQKQIVMSRIEKYKSALLEQDLKTNMDIKSNLEKIEKLMESSKVIDQKHHDLKNHIKNRKSIPYKKPDKKSRESESEPSIDSSVFCVTCGQLLSFKTASRHIEKCYSRIESVISYGSLNPSSSGIYCDFYDTSEESYCKRLKGVCPEHSKFLKVLSFKKV